MSELSRPGAILELLSLRHFKNIKRYNETLKWFILSFKKNAALSSFIPESEP